MSAALLLFGWMSLTGLVGWRAVWLGRWTSRLALGLVLLTQCATSPALQGGEG